MLAHTFRLSWLDLFAIMMWAASVALLISAMVLANLVLVCCGIPTLVGAATATGCAHISRQFASVRHALEMGAAVSGLSNGHRSPVSPLR